MSRKLYLAIHGCHPGWVCAVCCVCSVSRKRYNLSTAAQYYNSFKSFKEPVQDCLQSIKTILKRLPVPHLLIVHTLQQLECRITLAVCCLHCGWFLHHAVFHLLVLEQNLECQQLHICSISSPVPTFLWGQSSVAERLTQHRQQLMFSYPSGLSET